MGYTIYVETRSMGADTMDLIEQGKELLQGGKYAEALEVLKKALKEDQKNADLFFFVGTCYSSLGDFSAAKHFYQQALAINPNHRRTRNVWDGLDDVEARPPEDFKASSGVADVSIPIPSGEGRSDVSSSQIANTDPGSSEKWGKGFPDAMLETRRRGGSLGIWVWVLVAVAAAALVYFVVAPWLLP